MDFPLGQLDMAAGSADLGQTSSLALNKVPIQ